MKTLIANNRCIMTYNDEATLTIGKSYPIINDADGMYCITDDTGEEHWFAKESLSDFFDIPTGKSYKIVINEKEVFSSNNRTEYIEYCSEHFLINELLASFLPETHTIALNTH